MFVCFNDRIKGFVTCSPEEVLVSLWIRELHYVNNNSANKRMIQATNCYGKQKDVRAKSHKLKI